MKESQRPVLFIFCVVVALVAIVTISKMRQGPKGEDRIPWVHEIPSAQAADAQVPGSKTSGASVQTRPADQKKPVLVYFTATWCPPCQQMKETTWADAGVEKRLLDFVPVKIDLDAQKAVAGRYGITSIPTVVVLDAEGNIRKRTVGFVSAEELLAFLAAE